MGDGYGVKEQIRSSNDIVDVIGEYVALKGNAGICPIHGDSNPSLHVYPGTQSWYCFGCKKGGDVFDWISYRENLDISKDFIKILRILADRAGISMPSMSSEDIARVQEIISIEEVMTMAANYYHERLPLGIRDKYYHEQYGFTDETINELKLGYSDGTLHEYLTQHGISDDDMLRTGLVIDIPGGLVDFFQHRLIFPYWKHGKAVYFAGRQTENTDISKSWEQGKYRKLPTRSDKFRHISELVGNDYLYNEDAVGGTDYILITEGITDCISAKQAGIPSISPGTTQFRKDDILRLFDLTKHIDKIYICNDNEINKSGEKGALSMSEILEDNGKVVKLITLPRPDGVEKIDLNDYLNGHSREEFTGLINGARSPIEYLIEKIPADLSGLELLEALQPIFAKLSTLTDIYIDTYANFISKRWKYLTTSSIKKSISGLRSNKNKENNKADGNIIWEDVRTMNPALDFTDDTAYVATKLPCSYDDRIELEPVIITSDRKIISLKDSNTITDGYISRRPLTNAMRRWNIKSVQSFINGTSEDVDVLELYSTFMNTARQHVYFQDDSEYDMMFSYIVATYFYPMYDSFPYLWFNGEKGRGKTTAGKMIEALAFNGSFNVGSSEADFFRSIEQFRPTMIIDEAENLGTRASAEQQWITRVARAGYQRGATVTRRDINSYEKHDEFEVYCPKAFINIHGLEDVLADRAIPVTMTAVPRDIQSQLKGMPTDKTPGILEMRDKLYILMMTKFKIYREYINMDISDVATLRHAEVFRPILATAKFIDDLSEDTHLFDTMSHYAANKVSIRNSNSDDTPEELLKWALVSLLDDKDDIEVSASEIISKMDDFTSDSNHWCSEVWIGKNLRKLGIIVDKSDETRKREGNKQLRYYTIRRERVDTCIQGDWDRYLVTETTCPL